MIKKGFLLASFAIGVFANIFAQDTLSFKKTVSFQNWRID